VSNSSDSKKRKIEAALQSARATVALLEAELEDVELGDDRIRDLKEAAAHHNESEWTLRSWTKNGRLPATRGARGKLLVKDSDVRAARLAEPVVVKTRGRETPDDADPFEAMLASGELREGGR
jgi:hypothetical protein